MKYVQRTKLILHTATEDIDLSGQVAEMNIPRFPGGSADGVRVELFVDRFEVDGDGALVVHLKES